MPDRDREKSESVQGREDKGLGGDEENMELSLRDILESDTRHISATSLEHEGALADLWHHVEVTLES